MNIDELPDESDTSDEDYLPEGKQDDLPSEVDSDGDPEDQLSDPEDVGARGTKRKKKTVKRKKKSKIETTESQESGAHSDIDTKEISADEKKKQEDDLWADFMKDTGFQSRESRLSSATKPNSTTVPEPKPAEKKVPTKVNQPEKVKITQIFEFAGEEVKVEKEVSVNSAEARLMGNTSKSDTKVGRAPARGGLSGISNVLSQLGKKAKISTLEKSKLDWDRYKKEENLEEELQTYNKGKDGYLDRQDFLERADLRRFEIEKEIRSVERNKRMNNAL